LGTLKNNCQFKLRKCGEERKGKKLRGQTIENRVRVEKGDMWRLGIRESNEENVRVFSQCKNQSLFRVACAHSNKYVILLLVYFWVTLKIYISRRPTVLAMDNSTAGAATGFFANFF
jgi:hypothetical protein